MWVGKMTELIGHLKQILGVIPHEESVELQELLIYYSKIKDTKRRNLMRSVLREALMRDMNHRDAVKSHGLDESVSIRKKVLEGELSVLNSAL